MPVVGLEEGILDITVDGADEVDPHLDLIKGYGGALVRERIVATASRRRITLVGGEKLVPVLGQPRPPAGRGDPLRVAAGRARAGRAGLPADAPHDAVGRRS